jgi:hypothetical protein
MSIAKLLASAPKEPKEVRVTVDGVELVFRGRENFEDILGVAIVSQEDKNQVALWNKYLADMKGIERGLTPETAWKVRLVHSAYIPAEGENKPDIVQFAELAAVKGKAFAAMWAAAAEAAGLTEKDSLEGAALGNSEPSTDPA